MNFLNKIKLKDFLGIQKFDTEKLRRDYQGDPCS